MNMKWTNIAAGGMALLFLAGSLAGCGEGREKDQSWEGKSRQPEEIVSEEMVFEKITGHLGQWQETLPRDTGKNRIDPNAVRGLSLQKNGETVFAVSYEPRDYKESFDYWDISVPYESLVSVDTERLYELFDMVSRLEAGDTAAESSEEAEGSMDGLDQISEEAGDSMEGSDQILEEAAGFSDSGSRIFIAYDGEQEAGKMGMPEPTAAREIQIGKEDGSGHYYARFSETGKACLLENPLVDGVLEADPFSFILKIPALIQIDTVSKVEIYDGEAVHRMEREEESWRMDGKDVSQSDFQKCYGELLGVLLSGELPKDAQAEETREALLVLRFFRNSKSAPDMEIRYEDYDETSVCACVNGKRWFLAEKEEVENVREMVGEVFR